MAQETDAKRNRTLERAPHHTFQYSPLSLGHSLGLPTFFLITILLIISNINCGTKKSKIRLVVVDE